MRLPETIELKHATRGVNIFLLSKLGCETFGSQLLYLWEITVNEVQFQVPPSPLGARLGLLFFLLAGEFVFCKKLYTLFFTLFGTLYTDSHIIWMVYIVPALN